MAKITINGTQIKVKNGTTILKAAESLGLQIPTLCFLEEINEIGFCRVCVVEVEGEQDLVSACNTEVENGMVIETESNKVLDARKTTLALLASRHRFDCWRCPKDGNCEFYDLLKENDVVFEEFGPGIGRNPERIFGSGISQDQSKCVLCKRCVAVCNDVVTAKVLKFRDDDGTNPTVSPTVGLEFDDAGCIFCGQCAKVCPTGTLHETDHIQKVDTLLRDGNKHVYVQVDPKVHSAIAEEFGYPIGTSAEESQGKVYQALHLLGFETIADINLGSQVMVQEEAKELVARIQSGGQLPMYSSHCPAWVRYAELYRPEQLENMSSTRSPHIIQGSLIKQYYGPTHKQQNAENIAVVSVMTCTSNKYEISRDELKVDGVQSVDAVITVRELAKMIKRAGIDFRRIESAELDNDFATFIGAGTLPKSPGGVSMEALANAYKELEGSPMPTLEFKEIKAIKLASYEGSIQEATLQLKKTGKKLNVAVVLGGAAIKKMFDFLDNGKKQYDYIKFMACPGGCFNGGGMPLSNDIEVQDVVALRAASLYANSTEAKESEALEKAYQEFLTEPHKYCHTTYSQKAFTKE